jgi:putative CocE/NonD family hydrolase
MMPSHDGVRLATDVIRPDGPGRFPAILIRTCYYRRQFSGGIFLDAMKRFVDRGYAVVIQDVRGKFDSDGVFEPLIQEQADGMATLDWVANQRWSNGSVGMWGRSYLGMVQVPAASGGHPACKAIAPSIGAGNYFRDWIRYDGCFGLYNAMRWCLEYTSCRTEPPIGHFKFADVWDATSVSDLAERTGIHAPVFGEWARHDREDAYWSRLDHGPLYSGIRAPGYHVAGWFDHVSRGPFEAYREISDRGATDLARKEQRLLIAPYSHRDFKVNAARESLVSKGDWKFGESAAIDVLEHEIRFFDHFVREVDNGYETEPKVKAFLLGDNRWISFDDWPPPGYQTQSWHLSSNGRANHNIGDGRMSLDPPTKDGADSCVHDPSNPIMTHGGQIFWGHAEQLGNCLGPVDQRKLFSRKDVHYYRSEPLDRPLTVVGEPILEVTIASNAEDTDVMGKLCVELVSGEVVSLSIGQLRCRYRHSFSSPKPLARGQATALRIRLHSIAYRFPAGARIGLILTHSDYPRINAHPGHMEHPLSDVPARIANNTILHGPSALSRVLLPVVEVQ